MGRQYYWGYLRSSAYQKRRKAIIERANGRCERCGVRGASLEVNHKTYERLGNELPEDLEALCPNCHAAYHNKPQPELVARCPQCGELYVYRGQAAREGCIQFAGVPIPAASAKLG